MFVRNCRRVQRVRRRSDQFDARECIAKWNSFGFRNHGQKIGMGSLFTASKTDDFEEYKKIEERNVLRKIDASKGGAEYDVAAVVSFKVPRCI